MNKKEEIFTIGDKTTLGIITCFRLLNNEIIVDFDNRNSILLKSKQLQHSKQPLFTTEDGVDIFKNDKIYYVETEEDLDNNFKINEYIVSKSGRFISDSSIHSFSTEKAAENYVKMNKPCLSLQEIKDVFEKDVLLTTPKLKTIRILEKIVKQKLK